MHYGGVEIHIVHRLQPGAAGERVTRLSLLTVKPEHCPTTTATVDNNTTHRRISMQASPYSRTKQSLSQSYHTDKTQPARFPRLSYHNINQASSGLVN